MGQQSYNVCNKRNVSTMGAQQLHNTAKKSSVSVSDELSNWKNGSKFAVCNQYDGENFLQFKKEVPSLDAPSYENLSNEKTNKIEKAEQGLSVEKSADDAEDLLLEPENVEESADDAEDLLLEPENVEESADDAEDLLLESENVDESADDAEDLLLESENVDESADDTEDILLESREYTPIDPDEIDYVDQGSTLGDCYFLASLASKPDLINQSRCLKRNTIEVEQPDGTKRLETVSYDITLYPLTDCDNVADTPMTYQVTKDELKSDTYTYTTPDGVEKTVKLGENQCEILKAMEIAALKSCNNDEKLLWGGNGEKTIKMLFGPSGETSDEKVVEVSSQKDFEDLGLRPEDLVDNSLLISFTPLKKDSVIKENDKEYVYIDGQKICFPHAYIVRSYDPETRTYSLGNPWGDDPKSDHDDIKISADSLCRRVGRVSLLVSKNEDSYISHRINAQEFAKQNNYDKAIRELDAALRLRPDDLSALMAKVDVYLRQDEDDKADEYYEKALNECEKILEKNPEDTYALRVNAKICLGMDDKPVDPYIRAANISTTMASKEEYLERAFEDSHTFHNYDKVLDCCNKILESGPFNPYMSGILGIRAAIYDRKGEYDKALDDYIKAAKYSSRASAEEYLDKAFEVSCAQDNWDKLLNHCNQMLEFDHDNIYGYKIRGEIYEKQEKYDDAINSYKEAAKLYMRKYDRPKAKNCLVDIVNICKKQENWDKALDFCDKILDFYPNDADALKFKDEIYEKLSR